MAGYLRGWSRLPWPAVRERLGHGGPCGPLLVVSGSRDVVSRPADVRAFAAELPGAALETVQGCGHNMTFDDPEAVCAVFASVLPGA